MPRRVTSVEELRQLAAEISHSLRGGDVLLLSGPLGSGKTTFVQALASLLGVKEKVNSPSYTIAAEYDVPDHPTITKLVHVDLYRLPEERAGSDVAVQAVLEECTQPGRLTVIEWADRLSRTPAFAGQVRGVKLRFEHGSTPGERVVTVGDNGAKTQTGIN